MLYWFVADEARRTVSERMQEKNFALLVCLEPLCSQINQLIYSPHDRATS